MTLYFKWISAIGLIILPGVLLLRDCHQREQFKTLADSTIKSSSSYKITTGSSSIEGNYSDINQIKLRLESRDNFEFKGIKLKGNTLKNGSSEIGKIKQAVDICLKNTSAATEATKKYRLYLDLTAIVPDEQNRQSLQNNIKEVTVDGVGDGVGTFKVLSESKPCQ